MQDQFAPQTPPSQPQQLIWSEPYPPPRRPTVATGCLFWSLGCLTSVVIVILLLFGLVAVATAGAGGISTRASFGLLPERKLQERYVALNREAKNKIAIISVEGVIMDDRNSFVKRQIDQAKKDEHVKAVVLRVNSPGGTVTGSDYLYHYLQELAQQKPLVVSMGSLAASGGYYISMAVGDTPESIFAEPTTWTGSIGVIIPHFNLAELFRQIGIKEDSIASGPYKNMGSIAREMTEEEKQIFQELVDQSFSRFKEVVKSGRPKFREDPQLLDKVATGRIYTAQQAVELGLVDRIGFLEDAIDRAVELAGLSPEEVCVVEYVRFPSFWRILSGEVQSLGCWDLREILSPGIPRAYYLFTDFWPQLPARTSLRVSVDAN